MDEILHLVSAAPTLMQGGDGGPLFMPVSALPLCASMALLRGDAGFRPSTVSDSLLFQPPSVYFAMFLCSPAFPGTLADRAPRRHGSNLKQPCEYGTKALPELSVRVGSMAGQRGIAGQTVRSALAGSVESARRQKMLRFHSARTVPAQCPHSARTVPAQCPHGRRGKNGKF